MIESDAFFGLNGVTEFKLGNNDVEIRLGEKLIYPIPQEMRMLTFVATDSGTFKFSGNSVNYSVDNGSTWTSLASNTDTPTVPAGGKIIFKATLTPSWGGIGKFSSTGRFTAQGNPMSLLYGDNFIGQTSLSEKDYAFYGLFYNCTGLTSAENMSLPATTVTHACYANMFYGCTSLTTAPSLPATTLANYCYYYMFQGCTSLTNAPSLPATTLADYCYSNMFYGCTGLITAPELPATTLASNCYQYMFAGCTSLTNAPVLSATTLANYCYNGMFAGCTSLTTAPELPATTLASYCYQYMFSGCTSLTNAPELPATTLKNNCYSSMFNGCRNLNKITCLATDISASNCTYNWVSGVAASGTFTKADSMIGWEIDSVNGIPSGWTAQGYYSLRYLTFEAEGDCTFIFSNNINYSLDEGVTWTALARNTYTPTILAGSKIMWKATLTPEMYAGIGTFNTHYSSGRFTAQGNPMSLLYGDNFIGQTSINDFCFFNLFNGCTRLTSAKNMSLPATMLTFFGYYQMFRGCTSLTTAPELPATALASYCYSTMFYGCTSLITAPELPATILASECYYGMFFGCTSLTTAPSVLPATTLAGNCYNDMFQGCTSLTTAPVLPATTLAFGCYTGMFAYCTNLNKITCLATDISAYSCTSNWVNGVAASGTFLKAASMTSWTTGNDGIPTGWVTQEYYSYIYLTFEAIDNCQFSVNRNTVSYSTDNGATWLSGYRTSTIQAGNKVIFKANLTPLSDYGIDTFSSTGRFKAMGNPMSLLYGDDFHGRTDLTEKNYAFSNLFSGCTGLTSAENLRLPATTLSFGCYYSMFKGCTSLTNAPSLPATTLADYCYDYMFQGCTSLTTAPSLPATTLAYQCYSDMFNGCTSLTTAPVLSATTLAPSCYGSMFANCTSLRIAPTLPATTLASNCYQTMFSGCTSLTIAPGLPVTTLAEFCYHAMFSNCTSLTTAPVLPATTLQEDCYSRMFEYCTSLTTAPELKAATLAAYCYDRMFRGCTNLNSITCLATNISANACTSNWVNGVAATGTFTKAGSMTGWTTGNNGIPTGWNVIDNPETIYLTFVATDSGRFKFSGNSVNYSLDNGTTWTSLASDTYSPTVSAGNKIMFKATLTPSYAGIGRFSSTGRFTAQGNVMSLLYGDNFIGQTSLSGKNYVFHQLFYDCTGLTSAENLSLPATTLESGCYNNMFSRCTSLTTAPVLPATTLKSGCYIQMFYNCTRLTTAPVLSATRLDGACYQDMFNGCTSLTTAPSVLPATTLIYGCYTSMFKDCTSLTTAPVLPATTLDYGCYQDMFSGCTNLNNITCLATNISAPNCTNNWVNGVAASGTFIKDPSMTGWTTGNNGIPVGWVVVNDYSRDYLTFVATDSGTFKFSGNSINYSVDNGATWTTLASNTDSPTVTAGNKIMFKATLTPTSSTGIGNFSSTGRFTAQGNPMSLLYGDNFIGQTSLSGKNGAFMALFNNCTGLTSAENMSLPATTLASRCYYYMFLGCTWLATAPSVLPATTLAEYCYGGMFSGCGWLTTAPELPATTLADWCYGGMFASCTNLNKITCLATDISANGCTSYWVYGVGSTGTFIKDPSMTGWTTGINGIPTGWIVSL